MFGKRFLYVLRSDPRENLPLSYPVCPADDRSKLKENDCVLLSYMLLFMTYRNYKINR